MNPRLSLALSSVETYIGFALQLLTTAIVARILSPQEVGVYAIAATIVALFTTFRDFGLAEYLIQKPVLTRETIRSALGVNVLVSWSSGLAIFAAAPYAGAFYGEPGVRDVMRVLAVSLLLLPFGAAVQAAFRRELNYLPIAITNVISNVVVCAASLSFVSAGYGYVGLAYATLCGTVATVLTTVWLRPRGFPSWPRFSHLSEPFAFGRLATVTYSLLQLARSTPELALGQTAGAVGVGLFTRAISLVEMVRRLLLRPVEQICLPYLSAKLREQSSLSEPYIQAVAQVTAVGWPFIAALAVACFAAIRLVFGDQWTDAVPIARLLCVACALELTHHLAREAIIATGDAKKASRLQLEVASVHVVAVLVTSPSGVTGVAWGLIAANAISFVLTSRHLKRTIGLSIPALMRALIPSAALAALVAVPLLLFGIVFPASEQTYLHWAVATPIITSIFWVAGLKLLRHSLWAEVVTIARRMVPSEMRRKR